MWNIYSTSPCQTEKVFGTLIRPLLINFQHIAIISLPIYEHGIFQFIKTFSLLPSKIFYIIHIETHFQLHLVL